jgi:hypothetical protein
MADPLAIGHAPTYFTCLSLPVQKYDLRIYRQHGYRT